MRIIYLPWFIYLTVPFYKVLVDNWQSYYSKIMEWIKYSHKYIQIDYVLLYKDLSFCLYSIITTSVLIKGRLKNTPTNEMIRAAMCAVLVTMWFWTCCPRNQASLKYSNTLRVGFFVTGGCPTEYTVFLQFGFQEEWMELGHNLFGIC